ncbi:hypothetical protein E1B28_004980 [Marasmius oreades]|uniref:Uncharacterized protein n=1 Tax=Marasmius oreades TaxID=181124 RepID=A0A9P8ADN3_9AGAR|nr:uncharacterized protein E1B28_004980 [Marasmius oreades]KAG7097648.1 hypothetical protein E1B28_004980 [Marasmius oreades]
MQPESSAHVKTGDFRREINMNFTFLEEGGWSYRSTSSIAPGPSRSSTGDDFSSTSGPPPYGSLTNHDSISRCQPASIEYLPTPSAKQPSSLIPERERRPYQVVNEIDETFPLLPPRQQTSSFKFTLDKMLLLLVIAALHIFIISLVWILTSTRYPSPPVLWINVTASPFCSSVGSRIYTAVSSHVPDGFHPDTRCMERPIRIHGQLIPTPLSCYSELVDREIDVGDDGTRRKVTYTITRGKWLVDWDEESCIPAWDVVRPYSPGPVPDTQCQTHRERGYTAFMTISRIPPGLEALDACRNTPTTIYGQEVFPSHCQMEKRGDGVEVVRARFFVEESNCIPVWVNLAASPACTSIGTRMYTALSSHMPLGFQPDLHCSTRPIEIHGHVIPQPLSCHSEAVERIVYDEIDNSRHRVVQTLTTGEWLNDFEEKSCTPIWDPDVVPDDLCTSYGKRAYTAFMTVPRIPLRLDPLDSCWKTPLVIDGQRGFPSECHLENGVVRARFVVDDYHGCATAAWTNVQPDYQCSEYGIKKFTGFLEGIPAGLDPMEVCRTVPHLFFGVKEKRPEQCEKVRDGESQRIVDD